ncbi:hypothetical protein ACFY2V_40270 [Streptomyces eurythermus]|uniref:hypothetical protein n=1 Tax=Streptomyces eurythermus TaxID=42237 RepID=UPI0036D197CD
MSGATVPPTAAGVGDLVRDDGNSPRPVARLRPPRRQHGMDHRPEALTNPAPITPHTRPRARKR